MPFERSSGRLCRRVPFRRCPRPPLHYPACLSRRAVIILVAHVAELLARDGSDARTTGVVPLKLGYCRHGSRRRKLGVSPKVDAERPEIGSVKNLTGIP